jgi:hypothetical protein
MSEFVTLREIEPRLMVARGQIHSSPEVGFWLSAEYRAALESVEPDRPVRVKEAGQTVWEGTAAEMLALTTP